MKYVRIKPDCLSNVKMYMSAHPACKDITYDTIFEVVKHRYEWFYLINSGTYGGWELSQADFYEVGKFSFKDEIERILEI
jgi:hypothetical protein